MLAVWPSTFDEYAVFTDATIHLTDRMDLQLGGRESRNRQTYSEVDGGGYGQLVGLLPGVPLIQPRIVGLSVSRTY